MANLDTPPLVIAKLPTFIGKTNFLGQVEKSKGGNFNNYGFVDASFEAMMRSVGWIDGQAWCAYFMKICLMQLYSFDREWIAKKLTGGAYANLVAVEGYNIKGDKRYLGIRSGMPEISDVVCALGSKGGHTFMVTEILGGNETNGWKVKTIEGNTNLAGSREGDRVLQQTRTIKVGMISGKQTVKGYIRRNFTPSELERLRYDDSKQTFYFAGGSNQGYSTQSVSTSPILSGFKALKSNK